MLTTLYRQKPFQIHGTLALLFLTCLTALIGWLPLTNAFGLLIFSFCIISYVIQREENTLYHLATWFLVIILGFGITLYRPEGFHYPLIWAPGVLHEGGETFSLFANLSKGLAGYLLVLWLFKAKVVRPVGFSILAVIIGIGTILASATALGVEPVFKLPPGIERFIIINLLITVLAEEAFFRLLIQDGIKRLCTKSQFAPTIAVFLSAIIFALAHVPAFNLGFAIYLIAGLVYALVYEVTRRFSAAILVHVGVNVMHIIFLEYPLAL